MRWRNRIISAAIIAALLVALAWGWYSPQNDGVLIPGSSVFRTYHDSAHGMADTYGTFDLPNGNITVSCWSPGVVERTKYFDVLIAYPEYPGMHGPSLSQSIKLKAGAISAAFDATKCWYCLWINGIPREQLRQIASAYEAVFDVGNGKILSLDENQLAQIRGLISYTDTLPLFDFPSDDMEPNQTSGK
jgi:hypothetical protein